MQYLVEAEARISGPTPGSSELARWRPEAERWASEPLKLEGVALLRVRVRKGGAEVLRVKPVLEGDTAEAIALRELVLGLERDASPESELELEVDLREVLEGNWRDSGARPLSGLRMLAKGGEVLEVSLLDERALFEEPASVHRVEVGGLVRPSWALHDGVSVRLDFEAEEPGELRWHGASIGQGVGTVVLDDRELRLGEGLQRVRLEPGEHHLVLQAGGSGVTLFGDPRFVPEGSSCAPDVVLHLVDTLRRDALHRGHTPTFDLLAETGLEFTGAWSTSSWTKPAIVSLQTALPPTVHQVGARGYTDRLPETVDLLQERFREAGFRTGSFSSSPLGTRLSALDRGFSLAVLPRHWEIGPLRHPSASQVYASYLGWLDEEPELPTFAYLHTLEPHQWFIEEVYGQGPGTEQYARAVGDADRALAGLMSELRVRDRRDLVLAVVSDHGEAFDEHGATGHGSSLHEEQIAIPMLLWGEGIQAGKVEAPASLTDLGPTLLDHLELPPLPGEGRSLLPELQGEVVRDEATAHLLRGIFAPLPQQHAQVDRERQKIVQSTEIVQLFDLLADPRELAPGEPDAARIQTLERTLASHATQQASFAEAHGEHQGGLSAQDMEALRALGYVE